MRPVPCLAVIGAAGLMLLLSGCASGDDELEQFIAATKQESSGNVEPLPEVKPYRSFAYSASGLRSPFQPGSPAGASLTNSVRPDSQRNREFLEQFSLDTLRMVGTLDLGGQKFALIKSKDGLVHRVLPGNHIGQSDGKIIEIGPSKITLVEIVPDGVGGYMERPAALALSE
jgi:type IV pilus assembly protein PilP